MPHPTAFVTDLTAPDGGYLAWKSAELPVAAALPGYRGGVAVRTAGGPLRCVALWAGADGPAADPGYRALADRHGVDPAPSGTACDIVAAAAAEPGAELTPGAYVFFYDAEVTTSGAEPYENFKTIPGHADAGSPGFRFRVLLRHRDTPTRYTYLSVWDSKEDSRRFHDLFARSIDYRRARAGIRPYVRPPGFTDAEVVLGRTAPEAVR